jgi:hypothetical protein
VPMQSKGVGIIMNKFRCKPFFLVSLKVPVFMVSLKVHLHGVGIIMNKCRLDVCSECSLWSH